MEGTWKCDTGFCEGMKTNPCICYVGVCAASLKTKVLFVNNRLATRSLFLPSFCSLYIHHLHFLHLQRLILSCSERVFQE